jgi:release factor glutamine methyltransferase
MSSVEGARDSEWTIGRLLSWTTDYLSRHGIEEARLSAELLVAHAIRCRRIDLYTRFDRVPDESQLAPLRDTVKRAAQHEPIAYLIGEKEFFSIPLVVTRDVLIPRPETESLVEWVIDHCAATGRAAPRLLDVGTGSGCIVIATLVSIPGATGVATDVSGTALAVAAQNAERHKVLERLTLVRAEGFALPPETAGDRFDVVMSNPPYVSKDAMASLPAGVRDFEPRTALTDEGDGLSLYREAAGSASALLRPDGRVFVEIGDGQGEAVRQFVASRGMLEYVGGRKDRVTGRERVLQFARKQDIAGR